MNNMESAKLRKRLMQNQGRQNVDKPMVEPCDDPACGLCTKPRGNKNPHNLTPE